MATKKNPYLEDRKLIMHQFSEHTKALGSLTQEVRNLRDDVVAIKTGAMVEAKAEAKKDSLKTRLISAIVAGVISVGVALAF
jgi:predicted regulator of Ras-like GTPase activity (Roadblock/LC7/MglB family)